MGKDDKKKPDKKGDKKSEKEAPKKQRKPYEEIGAIFNGNEVSYLFSQGCCYITYVAKLLITTLFT